MCPIATTDLHRRKSKYWLSRRQNNPDTLSYILDNQSLLSLLCRSVATFGHIILPPRQPVFALSHVCRSVVTIGHSILPPR
jgi:hypothetical protein